MEISKLDKYDIQNKLMHDDAKSKILFDETWNGLTITELSYEKENTLFEMLNELERIGEEYDKPIILAVGSQIDKKMVQSLRKYGFSGKGIMDDGNLYIKFDIRKGEEI